MKIFNNLILFIIGIYRKIISPVLPPTCRFIPSCSHYTYQAFSRYNFFRATKLSIFRILKCHPFHRGGYDPLP